MAAIRYIDDLDRRILGELQVDATITNSRLAGRVGTSPATCYRRVRRLWETGLITRQVVIADANALGSPLTVITWIFLHDDRIDLLDRFKRACLVQPEIFQAYYVTGEPDFVLVVKTVDVESYHRFAEAFIIADPNVKRYESFVCMQTIKFETALPLRETR